MNTKQRRSNPGSSQRSGLTPKLIIQLAAPHTWAASIMPVLIALCVAASNVQTINPLLAICLLVICILMQSAVNTFNDYFDYVKGEDSADDDVEVSDAVLVYNDVRPSAALALAISFLVLAFLLGIYVIFTSGWTPFIIALVGALATVLYSAGKTPISHMPIGELVSGVVMGALIPIACYISLTSKFDPMIVVCSIPTVIGIGMIMLTNNACDIEKDTISGRKTLPVKLGRPRTRILYRLLLFAWVVAIVAIVAGWFRGGLILLIFMLLSAIPSLKALHANPLAPGARIAAMAQIASLNILFGAFYSAAILAGNLILSVG